MKAIGVFPKTKEVRVVEHPEPVLQSPAQAKIKMLEVGVCGTDREICQFQYGTPPVGWDYLIIGHESLGQVVEVSPGVTRVKVGDLVVPTVRRGCPENCISCEQMQQDMCFTGHFTERGIKQAHGYMCEFVVEEEKFLNVLPPELREVGVLLEPLTITEKALMQTFLIQSRLHWECRIDPTGKTTSQKTCRTALIIGAGPVGLLAAFAFCNLHMKTFVVARQKAPNEKAALLAAIGTSYLSTEELTPAQIAERVGPIDLMLEATGAAQVSFEFLGVLGTNGIFIFTGVPALKKDAIPDGNALMRNIVLKNQVVLGTVNAPYEAFQLGIRDLREFLQKWPVPLRSLITARRPFTTFRGSLLGRQPNEIKTVLEFGTAVVTQEPQETVSLSFPGGSP
ncbi:MAG: glucose 1-dehydrogenase [Elusimicrobia bacterium]|nr:glucose 1-dehydrogenase [Elusimicrobiota bacterium]